MSNPNQLSSPQPVQPTGPEFGAPMPTRTQRLALHISNIAMGGDRGASPDEVFDRFVTQVGGYQEGKTPGTYEHQEGARADTRMMPLAQDETTIGKAGLSSERRFKDSTAFDDSVGKTSIDTAVAKTLDGRRKASTPRGPIARARHSVARRAMKKATKGTWGQSSWNQ